MVNEPCLSIQKLTEDEIFMLDEAFSLRSTLSDTEEGSLFYISGYVAFKEGVALADDIQSSYQFKNSEFLLLLSRGKLSYPPPELFELCCVLFSYYKNVEKTCINHLLIGFNEIYESCQLNYESNNTMLRRFLNCFSKAFSNDESNKLKVNSKNDVKRRRVSYK